jgi:hypothetical protein
VRYKVLTAARTKMALFWDVSPWEPEILPKRCWCDEVLYCGM